MSNSKIISSAEELMQLINDYHENIQHTDAPFYLKYPFLDLIIEKPISEKRYKVINKSKKTLTMDCLFSKP